MGRLSPREKKEISAKLIAFNYSGIGGKLSPAITKHYRSFVGRDYKVWAQVCLFILGDYLSDSEKAVWTTLSKVCIYRSHNAQLQCVHRQKKVSLHTMYIHYIM